jgi:hypothetical protein
VTRSGKGRATVRGRVRASQLPADASYARPNGHALSNNVEILCNARERARFDLSVLQTRDWLMKATTQRSMNSNTKKLPPEQREQLLKVLKARFEKNMIRHEGLVWAEAQTKLEASADKLWSLNEMERTGGEPDVVGSDERTGEYIFYDCSAESPNGRRSLCYDREALASRKQRKPSGSALDMATAMGIEILTEEQYRELQKLGQFDTKTSSWIRTPSQIRKLGGALFCDRRYDTVFVYHNGAESYYAARAFRGLLRV